MLLDLQNPDSILAWWREFPQRHWAYLDALDQLTPQFRSAIQQARQHIRNDPRLSEMLAKALAASAPSSAGHPAAGNDESEADDDDAQDFAPKYSATLVH